MVFGILDWIGSRAATRGAKLERDTIMLLEKERSNVLLQEDAPPVNGVVCGHGVESHGITPVSAPSHLVIRWRGSAPTVQPFVGHDVTFAFVMAEHMVGIRDGDAVILVACHWSAQVWGRA